MALGCNYERVKKKFDTVCRLVNGLGGILLLGMMGLITVDVISRWLFNSPINGTFEVIELMMATTVALGLAYAGVEGAHVTVDFLVSKFSGRTERVFDLFNHMISAVFFFLMCWKSFERAGVMKDSEVTTVLLEIHTYPLLCVLGIGAGLLGVEYMFRFYVSLMGKGR